MIAQPVEGTMLGRWFDATLVASSVHNNTYNEVWGVVNNGVEYAIIGSTFGTHFIDISTDPHLPTEVLRLPGGSIGPQIIHRDYHDYKNLLYAVADEGNLSTLQIIDYSFLPDSVVVVYDSKTLLRTSHNIFIDTSSAIMYGCLTRGDIAGGTPLRLFDISDPTDPQIIASYAKFGNVLVSQVHDMYIRNDTAYLNCGPGGIVIVDFNDPLNPQLITSLENNEYPQGGYNHSGWLSEDGNSYFMADENWGKDIKVLDVSDLPNIEIIDTIDAGSESEFSIPHNQIIHNGLFYSSYYYDGLQVWDIRDIKNIQRVMYYPTSNIEARNRYEGAWGVYPFLPSGKILVSDMQEGLFVIEGYDKLSTVSQEIELNDEWIVYPNPSSGKIWIDTKNANTEIALDLFNVQGKIVQKLKGAGYHNLELESGVYYLGLFQDNSYSIKTIVIAN